MGKNHKNAITDLHNSEKSSTFALDFGKMAEWSIAAVLKTVDLHGSGGSNPSLSAQIQRDCLTTQVRQSLFACECCYKGY